MYNYIIFGTILLIHLCALSNNQIVRNPFQFSPPVTPHEQVERKEIATTEPVEIKRTESLKQAQKAPSSWEIVTQSEQGTIVRKCDGSLCKIQLQQ